MHSLDIVLRVTTFTLLFMRIIYWLSAANSANKLKTKQAQFTLIQKFKDYTLFFLWSLLGAQLFGLSLVPYSYNALFQCLGFLIMIVGVVVSVMGRRELGTNWAHGGEYQVKNNQDLVTTGIYRYIRHPIYLGVILAYVGGQIVAGSYLFILFLILFTYFSIVQAKKEEKLLIHHFREKYDIYMRNTKMLVPFVL